MLSEIAPEEYAAALDATAAEILAEADWQAPPVDALAVARRLGLEVAYDNRQPGRARLVNLQSFGRQAAHESILLRPDPRPERLHWSIAHEIGEKFAHRVFAALGVDGLEAPRGARESVANSLAGRVLLPGDWFASCAHDCDWDLLDLKTHFATASHELIARRMLDFEAWVTITVFDNGRRTFRRSNRYRRQPELLPSELKCRQQVADRGMPHTIVDAGVRVQCWPVYESDWKREILRTERDEVWEEND